MGLVNAWRGKGGRGREGGRKIVQVFWSVAYLQTLVKSYQDTLLGNVVWSLPSHQG